MKYVLLFLASLFILSGCVQLGNANIVVRKYAGDCGTQSFPCCKAYIQDGADIVVDGKAYQTDSQGKIALKIGDKGNHTIEYLNCDGDLTTMLVELNDQGFVYNKTFAYQNAEYEVKKVTNKNMIEINLACCNT